jgi:thymidylate synthase (FAD)
MKVIEPSFEIIDSINGEEILKKIELIGRVCYKSEDRITTDSAKEFIKRILASGHESVIEHEKISVTYTAIHYLRHSQQPSGARQ